MKRLLFAFVLTTVFLTACTQVTKQPELQTLGITNIRQLQWLTISGDTVGRLLTRNCAANKLNLPGQGYRASGSDGGMTYDLGLATDTTTASARGESWRKTTGMLAPVQRDAMMVIVDDFGGDADGNNAVYQPQPEFFSQQTLDAATLKSLRSRNKLSHGALVFQHAKDVIWGSGQYLSYSSPTPDTIIYYTDAIPTNSSKKLTVKAINTQFESTGEIAGSITTSSIATILHSRLLGTAEVVPPMTVVNLSFALMPCEVYADFTATNNKLSSDDMTFWGYLKQLADFNGVTYDELALIIVEATNDRNDPLFNLINSSNSGATKLIYVAASGNYGFKRTAMYPARWKGVVDVTGSATLDSSRRHKYFNTGEIMDVGASFSLKASRFTHNLSAQDVYYLGTSFSAPTVAAYSALDVASQQRCISEDPLQIRSKLAINAGNLVDAPLQTAVGTLCPIP